MITTEQMRSGRIGQAATRKSGDLPSKGAEMRQLKLNPGGVSGMETMMASRLDPRISACTQTYPALSRRATWTGLHNTE